MNHLRQAWAARIEAVIPKPDTTLYRALRGVVIPYDEDKEPHLSGREIVDRAIKQLRTEGYAPEHPGEWWFMEGEDRVKLEGAKFWANHFSPTNKSIDHSGHYSYDWAVVGFIYEARFDGKPPYPLTHGGSQFVAGIKLNIVAIHVTPPHGRWERVPVSFKAVMM